VIYDLRRANVARQAEWAGNVELSLVYKGNELAGEVGEACNVVKKLERERLGIAGSRDTVEHLAEELADVVICADLIALAVPLGPVMPMSGIPEHHRGTAGEGNRLGIAAGQVCSAIDAGDYHEWLPEALAYLVGCAATVAKQFGIDLNAAVVAKFNATSEKVGLSTKMATI